MNELMERKISILGEDVEGTSPSGTTYSNYYQRLTLECGHVDKYMTDLAAYKVGDTVICRQCTEIKKQVIDEVKEAYKQRFEDLV